MDIQNLIQPFRPVLYGAVDKDTASAAKVNVEKPNEIAVNAADKKSPIAKDLRVVERYEKLAGKAFNKLDKIDELLQKLNKFAVQSSSNILSDTERAGLEKKFDRVFNRIEKIAERAGFRGDKLFDGGFSLDAAKKLDDRIFTGAANQPTAEQAKLEIPKLLDGVSNLSISTRVDTISTLNALKEVRANINAARSELGDFSAAIQFAKNEVLGVPNNGPSITQVGVANNAELAAFEAEGGLSDIKGLVDRQKELAEQATSSILSDTERAFLDQQFQSLSNQIDRAASSTEVGGVALLDGSYQNNLLPSLEKYIITGAAGQPTAEQAKLELADFRTESLYKSSFPSISTQAGSFAALAAINSALPDIQAAFKEIEEFRNATNFARDNFDKITAGSERVRAVDIEV